MSKKKSLLETTLITTVRFGLNVRATLSTRVNSIKTRRKKPAKKAERKVKDRKRGSSLDKVKLYYEDIKTGKKDRTKGIK